MTKWRRLLAGVLACLLCLSLGGCMALDEARANHGFQQEDGILLGDAVYKLLPECEQLCPEWDLDRTVYVTEADVPVLLAEIMGEAYSISKDGVFLQPDWYYREDAAYNYCRADRYDEMVARINAGFRPEVYGYEYLYWDDETGDALTGVYTLNNMQMQAVDTVFNTVEPLTQYDINYDYSVSLEACSADRLFREDIGEICQTGNSYFLKKWKYDPELDDWVAANYTVPAQMNSLFDSIMSVYVEAENSWFDYDEEYDDDYDEEEVYL